MSERLLEEGDIIELTEGHSVYYEVPEHFVYSNKIGSFRIMATATVRIGSFLNSGADNGMDTSFLEGKYIVTKTCMDGGGVAMGHDVYPDGYRVWCENAGNHHIRVNFYQTGCFTAVISPKDIQTSGKAKISWRIK